MKFTFKSKFVGFGSPEVTMEFDADQIDDVLGYFKQFLQGSGYTIDGDIDIVNYDENPKFSIKNSGQFDEDGRC